MDIKDGFLFFHHFVGGEIEHQGYILKLNAKGIGVACFFSWDTGEAHSEYHFDKAWFLDCVFYPTAEAMNAAAEKAGK
jgi:hypothetical protein